jgi:hypothetical protein
MIVLGSYQHLETVRQGGQNGFKVFANRLWASWQVDDQ